MARRLGLCILILFSCLQLHAVEAVVAHSVFYLPDPAHPGQFQPAVEASWQINPRTLHYITTPANELIARIKTEITFYSESGIINEDQFILQTVPRHSVAELDKYSIIDLRRYTLSAGIIKMKFVLTDMQDTTRHFVFTDSFTVAPAADVSFYSDLQLLDTILPSHNQSVFYKNGQQQVPASTNFLGDEKRQLHYYTELYKTNVLPAASYPLVQRIFISKREEDPPTRKYSQIDTIKAKGVIPSWGSLDISGLGSGNFYLRATLENSAHTVIASKNLFFQRMNTHPTVDTSTAVAAAANDTGMESVNVLNLNKTFVGKYSLGDVRAILKMLLPVSDITGTNTIRNFLKKPDEIYMRYYIYNYFANINKKDPAKAWKDYTNRVKEVNRLFTAGGVPGYETDRGFIYLRYGAPTDIISVENESSTLPYEVWQYNELTELTHRAVANAIFLFYRPGQMTSDFKLLHSTVLGELQNPAWRNSLYKSADAGTNIESRAEQFIGNR